MPGSSVAAASASVIAVFQSAEISAQRSLTRAAPLRHMKSGLVNASRDQLYSIAGAHLASPNKSHPLIGEGSTQRMSQCDLRHNSCGCVHCRISPPNCPSFWIAMPIKTRVSTRRALAFDARSVVGRPARTITGLVLAATRGTRSTREECAPLACTSGLQRSASPVCAGHPIPTGISSHEIFEATI
jgi:hypothetical protein